jgi:hypothetical protein
VPRQRARPSHCPTGSGQLWFWDITWCAGPVPGLFYDFHLIIDIYGRKIVVPGKRVEVANLG